MSDPISLAMRADSEMEALVIGRNISLKEGDLDLGIKWVDEGYAGLDADPGLSDFYTTVPAPTARGTEWRPVSGGLNPSDRLAGAAKAPNTTGILSTAVRGKAKLSEITKSAQVLSRKHRLTGAVHLVAALVATFVEFLSTFHPPSARGDCFIRLSSKPMTALRRHRKSRLVNASASAHRVLHSV
ncbi:MAG: hypothetical protein ACREOY_00030 [Candidatus Dormibacteraceae bacterium]